MATKTGKCSTCLQDIRWVQMKKSGKMMPLNMGKKSVVTDDGEVVMGYESHFASCAQAGQHRR